MKLVPKQVAKTWGRRRLPAPFCNALDEKVGEIWFESAQAPLPLMIKYLFTSEKLSIQVHPSDDDARTEGLPSGKEECWLVLDADPGAVLGIGTREVIGAHRLRTAALTGEIETLMDWKPVRPGDFYYIPAGTVHAIGGGVSLIEIQQNADITYRLYDYGRPRELHLDAGISVADARPYDDAQHGRVDLEQSAILADGRKFHVALNPQDPIAMAGNGPFFYIPLSGCVTSGEERAEAGDCLVLDPTQRVDIAPGTRFLLARSA